MQQFGIGLAGLGNVGAGVFQHLAKSRALLRERLGFELVVRKVAVRDRQRARGFEVDPALLTDRWQDLLDDPAIQIVVELMGGKEQSLPFILQAHRAA